jgi:hypothetical protein
MSSTIGNPRRPFSTLDWAILCLHGLVAAGVGIAAFVGANDPEFGDLQRIVVVMFIGLWIGGIIVFGATARLVANPWARAGVLLAGPFVGILVVFGRAMFGWD